MQPSSTSPGSGLGRLVALTFYYAVASHLPDLAFPGGSVFNALRCAALRRILPQFGSRNEIDGQVYVGDGTDVAIGSRCQINRGCRLNRVTLGDCVMLAPDVIVIGQLHESGRTDIPMVEQGQYTKAPTVIEDDVWVGARAVVMPGVRIGTGAIVGAGAVVTRDVDPFTVVVGVPARATRVRERTDGPSSQRPDSDAHRS